MGLGFGTRFPPFWQSNCQSGVRVLSSWHLLPYLFPLFIFLTTLQAVLINWFCPVRAESETAAVRIHVAMGKSECAVYFYCCFSTFNRCRSYNVGLRTFLWNSLYNTKDTPLCKSIRVLQLGCVNTKQSAHAFSARGGSGLVCDVQLWALTQTRNSCRSLGAVLRTGASVWELSFPLTHQHLWEVWIWFMGRQRKKCRMGKRKIGEEGGGRGAGAVAEEREAETDRERTVSPFLGKGSLHINRA